MLKHVRHGSMRANSIETPSSPSDDNSYYSTPGGVGINPASLPQLDSSAFITHWQDRLCSPEESLLQNTYDFPLPAPHSAEGGFIMPQVSGYGEHSIVAVRASVMVYDDMQKKWLPSGSSPGGISKVHIYHHPSNATFRIVGRKVQDHEVVINCSILKGLKYNEATPTFHQWRDNRQVYGLNFATKEDAMNFSSAMRGALEALTQAAAMGGVPRPPQSIPPPQPPQQPLYSQPREEPRYDDRLQQQQQMHQQQQQHQQQQYIQQQQQQQQQQPLYQQGSWNGHQQQQNNGGTMRESQQLARTSLPDQMRPNLGPPQPPVAPPAPPAPPPPAAGVPPPPPMGMPMNSTPAPPAPPSGPPAPPAGGPPPPPPMPAGGIPVAPPPPPAAPAAPPAPAGGLAAAIAAAKLKKTETPAEGGASNSRSSNGGGGGGGMDLMAEMQKKLARRRMAADGDTSASSPSKPANQNNSPTSGRRTALEGIHHSNSVDNSMGTGGIAGGLATLPRLKRAESSGVLINNRTPSSNALVNGPSSSNGASASVSAEMEQVKQEILSEMRLEMNKLKQEILEAIRNEMRR